MLEVLTALFASAPDHPALITAIVLAVVNLLGALFPQMFKGKVAPKLLAFSQTGGPNAIAALRVTAELLGMIVTALRKVAPPALEPVKEEKKDA